MLSFYLLIRFVYSIQQLIRDKIVLIFSFFSPPPPPIRRGRRELSISFINCAEKSLRPQSPWCNYRAEPSPMFS